MQKIFNLTNKYIVLSTPLILYSLVSSVYLVVSASNGKILNLLFAIILFALMTSAFIAGWFKMIKLVILNPDDEEPNSLIKEFPTGVGEYFLSAIGALFVIFIISMLIFIASYFIGANIIGDPAISPQAFSEALTNQSALKAFVESLNTEQLIKLNQWNMLILLSMVVNALILFLYLPVLFFKDKNPFKAFFISIKDLFSKKIFKTIGIFLFIILLNSVISIFSAVFAGNPILHFVITLVNFYFITAVGIGVFYYYKNNFVKNSIGQNVDIEI